MRLALASFFTLAACGASSDSLDDAAPVIATYAVNAHAAYLDSLTRAQELEAALQAFVGAPSELTLAAAKDAWNAARTPYLQTEVTRFSEGPIDGNDEGTPEVRINSWPLDENYIDYVEGMPAAGIINDPSKALTKQALAEANMDGKEEFVSTGYHAIEFLLWGQDFSDTGPGARPFTDFVDGGTASNQARRRQYLVLVGQLLVDDLATVVDAWAPGSTTNYAHELTTTLSKREAVRRILTGMGVMASAELSGERMLTAYENKEQEDEHSCFSDTTHLDLRGDLQGIYNAYLGRYGANDGPGIQDLVRARDAALDAEMISRLDAATAAVAAIPAPFDQAIRGADTADGRVKVNAAIDAVKDVGETVGKIATLLDIELVVE